MNKLKIINDPNIDEKFNKYPKIIKPKINHLRKLIIETAKSDESISEIEETLKWGEPSYINKIWQHIKN